MNNNNNPSIGIVIVNYNGADYQNDAIKSIKNQTYTNYKIIVVDSASKDNSLELLRTEYPDVIILAQEDNVGVAAGNNIGIKYSQELGMDYTLLLNNDIELDGRLLERLLRNADANTITVPKIYFYKPSNTFWYAGGSLDWTKASVIHDGWGQEDQGQYDKKKYVTYSPTCCMLIHNSVFDSVGYEDETVFMYFDDTDMCVRMQDNGYKILYVPDAIMWHKVSLSVGGLGSNRQTYYMYRNGFYYMNKYRNRIKKIDIFKIYCMDFIRYILSFVWKKNNRYILMAYKDYKAGKMGRRDIF